MAIGQSRRAPALVNAREGRGGPPPAAFADDGQRQSLQASSRRSAAECTVARFMLPSYHASSFVLLWPSADAPPRGNGLLVEADRHPTLPLQPYRGVPVARASQSALLEARRGADVLQAMDLIAGQNGGHRWRWSWASARRPAASHRGAAWVDSVPPRKHSSASPRSRPTALWPDGRRGRPCGAVVWPMGHAVQPIVALEEPRH